LLAAPAEEPFKEVPRPLCRWRSDGLCSRYARAFYLSSVIGFRLDIRFSASIGHLHGGAALTAIGAFFVLAADVASSVAH
jgi:hypothetical protein